MIDSYINLIDDRNLLGLRTGPGGLADLDVVNDVLDSSIVFGPADGLGPEWLSTSGFLALSFEQDSEVHYGYVHLTTDVDGLGTMYPVTIDRFVFETIAGAPITIAPVAEPSTVALAAFGLIGLAAWGFRRNRYRRSTPSHDA